MRVWNIFRTYSHMKYPEGVEAPVFKLKELKKGKIY